MTGDYQPPSIDPVPEESDEYLPTERPLLDNGLAERMEREQDANSGQQPSPVSMCNMGNDDPDTESNHTSTVPSATSARPSRSRSDTMRKYCPPESIEVQPVASLGQSSGSLTAPSMPSSEPELPTQMFKRHTSQDSDQYRLSQPLSPSAVSSFTSLTTSTTTTNGSGSSSGSGSTITQASYTRRKGGEKEKNRQKPQEKSGVGGRSPKAHSQPNVLSFLEPDSPAVTQDTIQRSVEEASRWRHHGEQTRNSPSARSSSSSAGSFHSDTFSEPTGDQGTDRSSSPEHSVNGDSPKQTVPTRLEAQLAAAHQRQKSHRKYGTPEMPRGNANLPHIPPNALQPRIPQPYQGHVKHLPRAEKLPLTGYELLASRLTWTSFAPREIKPIYRRFETLNHRLLLHLQDELSELEEQLHRLDTADTQNRRLQSAILPASRRQEALTGGELQWHKTDILGKIGFKLGQYNHVLASFKETQSLAAPSLADVRDYREYLASHNPIAEIETRFLDPTDDLVSLARPGSSSSDDGQDFLSEDLLTPMPRGASDAALMCDSSTSEAGSDAPSIFTQQPQSPLFGTFASHLAVAFSSAVLLPMLAFVVIPGFLGRMAVVGLVGLGVITVLIQGGFVGVGRDSHAGFQSGDLLLCAGVYGGVMAVVAGISG